MRSTHRARERARERVRRARQVPQGGEGAPPFPGGAAHPQGLRSRSAGMPEVPRPDAHHRADQRSAPWCIASSSTWASGSRGHRSPSEVSHSARVRAFALVRALTHYQSCGMGGKLPPNPMPHVRRWAHASCDRRVCGKRACFGFAYLTRSAGPSRANRPSQPRRGRARVAALLLGRWSQRVVGNAGIHARGERALKCRLDASLFA